jgi:hypothetical protein
MIANISTTNIISMDNKVNGYFQLGSPGLFLDFHSHQSNKPWLNLCKMQDLKADK